MTIMQVIMPKIPQQGIEQSDVSIFLRLHKIITLCKACIELTAIWINEPTTIKENSEC